MFNIGCHLSVSQGYEAMGKEALRIGANTFQFFTRNPRGGAAKDINTNDAKALTDLMKTNSFAPILAHAPYTLNLCSANSITRKNAEQMILEDLARLELLPCHLYNFHPGSFTTQNIEICITQITEALNRVISPKQTTIMLLETMAGKGSEVGRTFEELKLIIDGIKHKEKIGVCMDTCHVYDAGYDIVNNLEEVLLSFDEVIGLNHLHAIHLNDSMNKIGSHKDRHQKIGEGSLGIDAIGRIINHPKLKHLPFLLETPNNIDGYIEEIALLKNYFKEK